MNFLEAHVGILFLVQPNFPSSLPEGFSDRFVYRPSEELKTWLEQDQNYRLENVSLDSLPKNSWLWKLSKSS